jgi:hypothetical protein
MKYTASSDDKVSYPIRPAVRLYRSTLVQPRESIIILANQVTTVSSCALNSEKFQVFLLSTVTSIPVPVHSRCYEEFPLLWYDAV